jgi:hypothetical protein
MYESDLTKFMRKFLEEHPEEVESQRKGRAIWWDKTPEALKQTRQMDEGRVPMTPYVYQTE